MCVCVCLRGRVFAWACVSVCVRARFCVCYLLARVSCPFPQTFLVYSNVVYCEEHSRFVVTHGLPVGDVAAVNAAIYDSKKTVKTEKKRLREPVPVARWPQASPAIPTLAIGDEEEDAAPARKGRLEKGNRPPRGTHSVAKAERKQKQVAAPVPPPPAHKRSKSALIKASLPPPLPLSLFLLQCVCVCVCLLRQPEPVAAFVAVVAPKRAGELLRRFRACRTH